VFFGKTLQASRKWRYNAALMPEHYQQNSAKAVCYLMLSLSQELRSGRGAPLEYFKREIK
jgi:hypothetical protein